MLVLSDFRRGRNGMTGHGICWHCGGQLIWQSDCDYEDLYHEGEGIISFLTCQSCHAEVQYSIRFDNEGD